MKNLSKKTGNEDEQKLFDIKYAEQVKAAGSSVKDERKPNTPRSVASQVELFDIFGKICFMNQKTGEMTFNNGFILPKDWIGKVNDKN